MQQFNRDPDASIVATFRHFAVKNEIKSAEAGRPIFDDIELCELRYPGSRSTVGAYPAHSFSHWTVNAEGEQVKVSYAERFARQYQQFKAHTAQTKSGTPLEYALFVTEGKRSELRALNIYTVEALAAIDGQELKNLGPGGRELKNRAQEYLAESTGEAAKTKMAAELEALRAQHAVLKDDFERLKGAMPGESEFDDMSAEQLRDYIRVTTGQAPVGNLNRKNLLKLAITVKSGRDEAA